VGLESDEIAETKKNIELQNFSASQVSSFATSRLSIIQSSGSQQSKLKDG
jgi:hypothetical protein